MTKKQIKQISEEIIEGQMSEFDLEREEVIELALYHFLDGYINENISKEDLLEACSYLEYPLDMDEVEKLKAQRKKQAEYRARYKAKKKLERQKRREELAKHKKGGK